VLSLVQVAGCTGAEAIPANVGKIPLRYYHILFRDEKSRTMFHDRLLQQGMNAMSALITRVGNEFFTVLVPGGPRIKFCCSAFDDSHTISLLCQWKAKTAKPIMNLQVWDRAGQALAFQYQGHASNLATRTEQKTEVNDVLSTLTRECLEVSGTFREWTGILQEVVGPALTNSQVQLVCNSDARFRAYLQLSLMCSASELLRVAADICESLVVADRARWRLTEECGTEVIAN
jgi:hypothetical protein